MSEAAPKRLGDLSAGEPRFEEGDTQARDELPRVDAAARSDIAAGEADVGASSRSEERALALATEGGTIAVEVELEPLPLHPLLEPSPADATAVAPAAGFWGRSGLFIITVVLPMIIGAVYLVAFAAPRFASSASLIVRSVTQPTQTAQDPMATLIQQVQQAGSTIAYDETNAIAAYLSSHDIVDQLAKQDNLREILSRPEGDFLFRYPTFWLPDNNEFLYQRFQWMTKTEVDPDTVIVTIEVNAFRPEDAQALLTAMLGHAESLVNQLNERMYQDSLAKANQFVAEDQKEVDRAVADLQAYRNLSGSIDPNAVNQAKLQVIQGLSTQLAQVQATIAQQAAIAPNSPALNGLRAQAKSLGEEIDKRKLEAAGSAGSEADKLETYDRLKTWGQIAAQSLSAVTVERDQAQQNAERQHLFVEIIAKPNLARDYALYPRVTLDLLILLGICLAVFQILRKIGGLRARPHC